ncbi:unnamed protein product [Mytilus coruscus]|uniref:COR domain-containing protein n=1 Tax=Mytilus coruscus TaxID=42192 RepID=A0A6J8D9M9_MYTCO|nr:unnamed protein product [Mytilus coruscus]
MLAGEQGTGKTTIARYLIGKGPTRMRKSTDGIGLYTGLSYIDRETEEWLDGKQEFSLTDITISRSLRQTSLGLPTSKISTGLSANLSNRHEKSLTADASVPSNEKQIVEKHGYKRPGVHVDYPHDKSREPKVRLGIDKQQVHSLDKIPISNVHFDLDSPSTKLNNEPFILHEQKGDHRDEKSMPNIRFTEEKQNEELQNDAPIRNILGDVDSQHRDPHNSKANASNLLKFSDQQNDSHEDTQCKELQELKDRYQKPGVHVDYPHDKSLEPKVFLDIDKQQVHFLYEIPIQNVQFDLDSPSMKFENEPYTDNRSMPHILFTKEKQNEELQNYVPIGNILSDVDSQNRDTKNSKAIASNLLSFSDQPIDSNKDTKCKELEDVVNDLPMIVHDTNGKAAKKVESQEYKPNKGSSLVIDDTKHSSFPIYSSRHASLVREQMKTLTKSSEVEQATSGLIHSVESVTNQGLITHLKKFFRVSKEVKEIKVSITEKHMLKQSLKVGKKKLHRRNIAPVIIWDFGGQDIFYSTHQSFLSYRAIYLIVLDGSRTLDDPCQFEQYLPGKSGPKTARDYLRFWINTIVTYCKGSHHGFPKIMIVFTHKDKLKSSEVETTREQLFGDVKSMFHGSPLMSHLVIEDKIFVNARNKNDPEMAKIRRGIIRESKLQPTWGQNFPKCFIPLELEFENLIRENINVITFDDLRKINTQHPIRPLSDAELKVFLKFQHAIGKILYFDEPGLDTHITLLPTYLIDAFKSIITDKRFCKGEKQREHLWNLMSQKGVISKCAIEKLWRNGKYRRFEQHKDYLVAVMTHLDILVEPKRYNLKRNRIPTDFYFVASMVQAKDETGYLQSPFLTDRNIAIAFSSNATTIPPALSFRFITYCLSIFDVKKYDDRKDDMLFHRSAVFTIDPSLEIHILCEDERIFVRLVHAKKKVLILKDLASSICDCLKSALQNISQLYIQTSSDNSELSVRTFEMNLCCSVAKDPCLLSIGEFNKIDSIWVCPGHKLDHEKFVMSSWITEKDIMKKCEITCPVTNEDFLSEDLSALHLRRLSILYNVDEIRELVTHLELPYTEWKDVFIVEPKPQLLKFKALCLCHEQSTLTFRKIKKAVEEGKIQNPHILCKVMRGAFVDFDTDPEKWDLVPSDEDIDKMAPLIGNKSLFFLVELGMDLETWDTINHRQTKRDLVKLNKDILDEWMLICKAKNVRPTMRMIAQAYKSIGKDIQVLENTLFN